MKFNPFRSLYSIIGLVVVFFGVIFFGGAIYVHESGMLLPGPVSAVTRHNEGLGGFVSHAEFERECTHCHAPLHCITDVRCQDCHMDVARQRTEANGLHGHIPSGRCQDCHMEHQGREVAMTTFAFANIDHDKMTGFSLVHHRTDYEDSPLTCESCHSQERYVNETLDCLSCHAHADHDFTADHMEQYGTNCTECHDGRDRMAYFDHNQIFPLEGKHSLAMCSDCHIDQTYTDTPRDCAGCHQEPDIHQGEFGTDCARCHIPAAWSPAHLTQHTFPLYHGSSENLPCETCHVQTYTDVSCYECHDHTPDQMQTSHTEIEDYAIKHCAACHPTGQRNETVPDSRPGSDGPNIALK